MKDYKRGTNLVVHQGPITSTDAIHHQLAREGVGTVVLLVEADGSTTLFAMG